MLEDVVVFDDYFNKMWIQYDENGNPFLHHDLRTEWFLSTYKTVLSRLKEIRDLLNESGHPFLYVLVTNGDPKMHKFLNMCGFDEVVHFNEQTLYMQETI